MINFSEIVTKGMAVILQLVEFALANPLTVFNSLLLILTAGLSYNSYISQKRASVRESLEQLDDVAFYNEKLKPMLHHFHYIPFVKSKSVVMLKYYQNGKNPASANQPIELFNMTFGRVQLDDEGEPIFSRMEAYAGIESVLSEIDGIDVDRVSGSGIYFAVRSVDPVEVRDSADTALTRLKELHTHKTERFIENFDVDVEDGGSDQQ